MGFAQNVCLSPSAPTNCPAGATLLSSGSGWSANLSSIPGATWIYAPGITSTTAPAFPAEFFFSKAFNFPGTPTGGTIFVAVDDFAEVLVNNMSVGTTGSLTDSSLAGSAQSSLAMFNIGPFLIPGTNIITIRVANGLFGCGPGPYSCNPAGVVFGGSFQFQPFAQVGIDIKPGSFPNSINPRSNGVIPVAILTTDTFDATTVDIMNLRFGPNGAVEAHGRGHIEDVDGDGDLELVLHFRTQDTGIVCGATSATLTGNTFTGHAISGSDSVNTVGCK